MAMSRLLLLNMPLEGCSMLSLHPTTLSLLHSEIHAVLNVLVDMKVQGEIQEREMSLETFQVRIGEAEAKTNDLKASSENLCGMVKMPQDASSSTVRDTRGLLIQL
ncbi:uncharacterized protein Pyn_40820 [Prunus yedoensis var. nudiflora]|uniref:Uncharacterized protein n=1 Tax=Prunus yedoensis var. nudiflora TaxID=2094558 RepID=A0A314ZXZ8_PRUYE|nr:uncharacterized protein Pyn_40820 [Prunus yedoensis var. nudiflora]